MIFSACSSSLIFHAGLGSEAKVFQMFNYYDCALFALNLTTRQRIFRARGSCGLEGMFESALIRKGNVFYLQIFWKTTFKADLIIDIRSIPGTFPVLTSDFALSICFEMVGCWLMEAVVESIDGVWSSETVDSPPDIRLYPNPVCCFATPVNFCCCPCCFSC